MRVPGRLGGWVLAGLLLHGLALPGADSARTPRFNGEAAMKHVRAVVNLGPRPSGSAAHGRMQRYIKTELAKLRCQVTEDRFSAQTPAGAVPMVNLMARFAGTSGKSVVITNHYDTKRMLLLPFVGANDAGSSTGALLELARVVNAMPHRNEIVLVWFDGEEAVAQWTESDSLYGSRRLATQWEANGMLRRIKALINIDMIGDKELSIANEQNSAAALRQLVWRVGKDLGYASSFNEEPAAIEDDHMPFVRRGVPALDLIDFQYGPDNSYWHTDQDTLEKLSPASLQVIGRVLVETLRRLE